jgi:hypothetical protein
MDLLKFRAYTSLKNAQIQISLLCLEIGCYEYTFRSITKEYVLYTNQHKTALTQKIASTLRTELPFIGGKIART